MADEYKIPVLTFGKILILTSILLLIAELGKIRPSNVMDSILKDMHSISVMLTATLLLK